MTEFEYKMEKIRRDNWKQALADLKPLGESGWELCHLDNKKDTKGKVTGIFKKVKPAIPMS
jgi:hypothetical protein